MKLSFALPKAKTSTTPGSSLLKRPAALTSLEDDDPYQADDKTEDAAPTFGTGGPKSNIAANKRFKANAVQTSSTMSRTTRKKLEEQEKLDKTIFEYDEVYEVMKLAETKAKEAKEVEGREKKVRQHFESRIQDYIYLFFFLTFFLA